MKRATQAGSIIIQFYPAAMELGHGTHKTQADPGAGHMPTAIEAQHLSKTRSRSSGAMPDPRVIDENHSLTAFMHR